MSNTQDALDQFINVELGQPVMAEAKFLAKQIAEEMGEHALAVLFYGSCLRTGDGAGLMDFYVLTDGAEGYGSGAVSRFAHTLVPPLVRYAKNEFDGKPIHAKVAVITLERFAELAQHKAFDISIWARFAQPTALVFARDKTVQARVHNAIRKAIITGINWAVYFGPDEGTAGAFWCALFRATYAAELRIENQSRADQIIALAPQRYDELFLPALAAAGYSPKSTGQNTFRLSDRNKRRLALKLKWLGCQITSKTVNLLRIFKGAVTFEGRADYVAWKLERQTGVTLELTPWQRDHPLLASPQILFQMWRKGAFANRH